MTDPDNAGEASSLNSFRLDTMNVLIHTNVARFLHTIYKPKVPRKHVGFRSQPTCAEGERFHAATMRWKARHWSTSTGEVCLIALGRGLRP